MIDRGHAKVCRALKHMQMFGLFGDHRNRLYARRTRTDDTHTFAREINFVMWPLAGVIPLTFEVIQALKVWHARQRQVT